MAKNDDLFEVELGEVGATPMMQSGVTQPDTKTVDDSPHVAQAPKNGNDEFELVENLLEDSGKEPDEEKETKTEETVKELTEKTPPSVKETKETNDASDSFAFVFAESQQEEGNLSFDLNKDEFKKIIEEEGEAAAITWLWNKEKEHVQNTVKEMYDADAKELMDLKDAGVDSETARELVGNKIKFESITDEQLEEKEDLRRQVLTQNYLNTTSLSEDRIKKLVDRAIATGDDLEESKEALEAVKKFNVEQIKAEKKAVEDAEIEKENKIKEFKQNLSKQIEATKEILPGIELSKQAKKDIERMTSAPIKAKSGKVYANEVWARFTEEGYEKSLIKLAGLMQSGVWDGKIDKLERVAKTKVTNKLEEAIKAKGGSISNKGKTTATAGDEDALSTMHGVFPV